MRSIREDMDTFRMQINIGSIQKAYKALLSYMMDLRTHFKSRQPGYSISGLYQGYMDMTYFAMVPPLFKRHNLKVAIVFNYNKFRFEAWLAGTNRQVQRKYQKLFKDHQWPDYRIMTPAKGVDSILECDLAEDFDFGDREYLTASIEEKAFNFINDIESILSGIHSSNNQD
jgi:hypothetical protein